MKQLRYIVLILFVTLLYRSSGSVSSKIFQVKKTRAAQTVKTNNSISFQLSHCPVSLKRQLKPKKPKGIQVIVPNIEKHDFLSYSRYADVNEHEVQSSYSLLVIYAHGKRGPPAV